MSSASASVLAEQIQKLTDKLEGNFCQCSTECPTKCGRFRPSLNAVLQCQCGCQRDEHECVALSETEKAQVYSTIQSISSAISATTRPTSNLGYQETSAYTQMRKASAVLPSQSAKGKNLPTSYASSSSSSSATYQRQSVKISNSGGSNSNSTPAKDPERREMQGMFAKSKKFLPPLLLIFTDCL